MKEQLLKNYLQTPFKIQPFLKQKNIININFRNGPFVEVLGALKENYEILFENRNTFSTVHSASISNGMWTSCNIKYYVPWRIKIKSDSSFSDWELVRIPRLSVMPVTLKQWNRIQELSKEIL